MEAVSSYQSAVVFTSLFLGWLGAAEAAPYEDTQHRFRLTLPDSWAPTPEFGDTNGMVFSRAAVRRGAKGSVFRIKVESPDEPKAFLDRREAALGGDIKKDGEEKRKVGGHPSWSRRYLRGGSGGERISLLVVVAVGKVFVLELESPLRDQGKLAAELEQILAGFEPLGSDAPAVAIRPTIDGVSAQSIAGRWQNADGLVMALGDDSSFALAEASGRYEVVGDKLTLVIPGQGRESFTFAFDGAAGTLTLSSPNLDTPMVYRRMAAGKAGPSATGIADAEAKIAGSWATTGKKGEVALELTEDRHFSLGPHSGRWSATATSLKLDRGGSDVITYQYQLKGGALLLAGGDLDAPVRFQRSK